MEKAKINLKLQNLKGEYSNPDSCPLAEGIKAYLSKNGASSKHIRLGGVRNDHVRLESDHWSGPRFYNIGLVNITSAKGKAMGSMPWSAMAAHRLRRMAINKTFGSAYINITIMTEGLTKNVPIPMEFTMDNLSIVPGPVKKSAVMVPFGPTFVEKEIA